MPRYRSGRTKGCLKRAGVITDDDQPCVRFKFLLAVLANWTAFQGRSGRCFLIFLPNLRSASASIPATGGFGISVVGHSDSGRHLRQGSCFWLLGVIKVRNWSCACLICHLGGRL